jgi:hypothetical protein
MLITEKRKYHMASFSSDEENPFIPLLYHNGALNLPVSKTVIFLRTGKLRIVWSMKKDEPLFF